MPGGGEVPIPYRIFGAELSPYSVKVRSYFRFKALPHEWIVRTRENMAEFQRRAKLPLIPLVVTPEDENLQDSTPILERVERDHPEPTIHPADPALAFLSALVEEYGDEWGNKAMFHYRWTYPADQDAAAERLAPAMAPAGASSEELAEVARAVKERMVPRLSFVGSSPETRGLIEDSYRRQLRLLEAHLAERPYLFGERPAFGDFGLAAQLYECSIDPTPGALLRESAPRVAAWVERMLEPKVDGDFEDWEALAPTLAPLLREEVGAVFLPWSDANARALAAGEPELSVDLPGGRFRQQAQKYHAKSLGVLRERYAAVADRGRLDPVLEETGCLRLLRAP